MNNYPDGLRQSDFDRVQDVTDEPGNLRSGPPEDLLKILSRPLIEEGHDQTV